MHAIKHNEKSITHITCLKFFVSFLENAQDNICSLVGGLRQKLVELVAVGGGAGRDYVRSDWRYASHRRNREHDRDSVRCAAADVHNENVHNNNERLSPC